MKHETQRKSKKKKIRGWRCRVEKWKNALKFRQMRNCGEKKREETEGDGKG
jgi:hypothetical protein